MKPVSVTMPLELTAEMIRAVREDPTTKAEDWEMWHRRLGWLVCAWDVLVEARPKVGGDMVPVPREALEWLMGERGEFEPADAHMPQPAGYKQPPFWWRSEFRKRAGLD
jgi:hypothetical protein